MMAARVQEFFREYDLLLTPTMAIPPFRHPKDLGEYPHTVNGVEVGSQGWHPFTFPFNLTTNPAATVPCGFTDDGLPLGLQIVGRRFEDLLVVQAAAAFEGARPWADKRPPIA
jgi:aspartyl-tRNA(Asn)/glutamyl-tRNA(Gln) amidotransferase subunit A